MKLNVVCQGLAANPPVVTAIDVANFSNMLNAVGPNTLLTLSNAQGRPLAELAPVVQGAGSKNLALDIDGTMASENQALGLINAAVGPNTSVSISSINSFTEQSVTNVVNAAAGKKLALQINGTTASQNRVLHIVNAVKNTPIPLTISSITSLPSQAIPLIFSTAGSKALSVAMDGSTSTLAQITNVLNSATANTSLELSKAEGLGYAGIIQVIEAAQSKPLNISINAEQFTAENLKAVVQATKSNMSVTINNASAITASNLSQIVTLSGNKALAINMNGQSSTTDQLNNAVVNSKPNGSVSVDIAHAVALGVILNLINASGGTNLTLRYNGTQLVVTPTDGNYVVRALQVAKPTTSIVVQSVGVTNFNLQLMLDIINAAG